MFKNKVKWRFGTTAMKILVCINKIRYSTYQSVKCIYLIYTCTSILLHENRFFKRNIRYNKAPNFLFSFYSTIGTSSAYFAMFFLCRKNTLSSKTVLKTKARKKKKQEIPTRNNHRSWFPWIPIKHFFPYHFQTAHINIVLTLRPTTFGRSLNRMFAYYYLTSGDLAPV